MMYKEFLEIVNGYSKSPILEGVEMTEDYYHSVVEPEYNRSNLDKEKWVKQFADNGGFIEAFHSIKYARHRVKCFAEKILTGPGSIPSVIMEEIGQRDYYIIRLKNGELTKDEQSELAKMLVNETYSK